MQSNSLFIRYRKLLVAAALVVAFGLWYAFRPEKLFINQKVSEAAPAGIADTQPLFTGSLHASASSSESLGRVNVVRQSNKQTLQLVGLQAKSTGPLTVSVASGAGLPEVVGTIDPGVSSKDLTLLHPIDAASTTKVMLADSTQHTVAVATLDAF